jgi:hypothetical protein
MGGDGKTWFSLVNGDNILYFIVDLQTFVLSTVKQSLHLPHYLFYQICVINDL